MHAHSSHSHSHSLSLAHTEWCHRGSPTKRPATARERHEHSSTHSHTNSLVTHSGVTVDNIASIAEAGVDMFVAGSAILKAPRTQEAYKEVSNSSKLKP